jgi:hypothetical protein
MVTRSKCVFLDYCLVLSFGFKCYLLGVWISAVLRMGYDSFYHLRNKTDGKCSNCGKRLSLCSLSVQFQERVNHFPSN